MLKSGTLTLALLMSLSAPAWADRDDDNDRKSRDSKKEYRQSPDKPQNHRVEPRRELPPQAAPRAQEVRPQTPPGQAPREYRAAPKREESHERREDSRQGTPSRNDERRVIVVPPTSTPPAPTREYRSDDQRATPATREYRTGERPDYRAAPPRDSGRDARPASPRDWPVRESQPAPRAAPKPGYVLDSRYRHNHYYPPRGHIEHTLPSHHHTILYRNTRYHYHNGSWYLAHNSRFVVVAPPVGIYVSVLPYFYTTLWVGTTTYYYAGGVYYAWTPSLNAYVVVDPPRDEDIRETQQNVDQIFVYPKYGQGEQQQANDRYECHRWAQSETGFDPTRPGGDVAASQYAGKRADYFRAMKACLEARGYSIQ
jgi:hypothetical protein